MLRKGGGGVGGLGLIIMSNLNMSYVKLMLGWVVTMVADLIPLVLGNPFPIWNNSLFKSLSCSVLIIPPLVSPPVVPLR